MNWEKIKLIHNDAYNEFIEWSILETEVDTEPIEEAPFMIYSGMLMQFFDEKGIKILIRECYSYSLRVYDKLYECETQFGTIGECLDAAYIKSFYILDNSKKIEL
jgi:hypothetical protein